MKNFVLSLIAVMAIATFANAQETRTSMVYIPPSTGFFVDISVVNSIGIVKAPSLVTVYATNLVRFGGNTTTPGDIRIYTTNYSDGWSLSRSGLPNSVDIGQYFYMQDRIPITFNPKRNVLYVSNYGTTKIAVLFLVMEY